MTGDDNLTYFSEFYYCKADLHEKKRSGQSKADETRTSSHRNVKLEISLSLSFPLDQMANT